MKVLMINGSPKKNGNTYTALHEMETIFEQEGIETEILHIGNKDIRRCISCGRYWNGIHGSAPGEAKGDVAGLQMMRTLARNMSFLMKSIAPGKEKYSVPAREPFTRTNFIC
ncbi:MAG: flavodoxin family protein [Lachnospiraceae bacterium]|nr:flavodoxin family protein [Lachnospiraceae bacterium]